jgi:hypothetical protein
LTGIVSHLQADATHVRLEMPQVLQETGYVLREVDNEQALQRLEILLLQICKAAEYSARVVVHGNFNMEPGQVRGQRVLHGGHA